MRTMTTTTLQHARAVRNTRWWHRGGAPLWMGMTMLCALSSVHLMLPASHGSENRQDFALAPSHSDFLRSWLSPRSGVDYVCIAFVGSIDGDCTPASSPRFAKPMPPIARVGKAYRYAPSVTGRVVEWRIDGPPTALTVHRESGLVSGIPTQTGRFEITLSAVQSSDSIIQQRITLYVDDRVLWFGADRFGEDIFRNALVAVSRALLPAWLTVCVGVVGGLLIGALAGYYGGAARQLLVVGVSALQSVPGLLLVFIAASASDLNRWVMTMVVGLILAPEVALGVMQRVESFRSREFVDAGREIGLPDRTILWHEIVWLNGRDFLVQRVANGLVFAILMDITLSYVGLLDSNVLSIGTMLRSGRATLVGGGSSGEAVAAVMGILLLITTSMLMSRGVRALWSRPR
jgi:peptide/nickel transport system permease protein